MLFTDKDGDVYIRVARLPRILHMRVLSQKESFTKCSLCRTQDLS